MSRTAPTIAFAGVLPQDCGHTLEAVWPVGTPQSPPGSNSEQAPPEQDRWSAQLRGCVRLAPRAIATLGDARSAIDEQRLLASREFVFAVRDGVVPRSIENGLRLRDWGLLHNTRSAPMAADRALHVHVAYWGNAVRLRALPRSQPVCADGRLLRLAKTFAHVCCCRQWRPGAMPPPPPLPLALLDDQSDTVSEDELDSAEPELSPAQADMLGLAVLHPSAAPHRASNPPCVATGPASCTCLRS